VRGHHDVVNADDLRAAVRSMSLPHNTHTHTPTGSRCDATGCGGAGRDAFPALLRHRAGGGRRR
jgi:hypothetical protein